MGNSNHSSHTLFGVKGGVFSAYLSPTNTRLHLFPARHRRGDLICDLRISDTLERIGQQLLLQVQIDKELLYSADQAVARVPTCVFSYPRILVASQIHQKPHRVKSTCIYIVKRSGQEWITPPLQ